MIKGYWALWEVLDDLPVQLKKAACQVPFGSGVCEVPRLPWKAGPGSLHTQDRAREGFYEAETGVTMKRYYKSCHRALLKVFCGVPF